MLQPYPEMIHQSPVYLKTSRNSLLSTDQKKSIMVLVPKYKKANKQHKNRNMRRRSDLNLVRNVIKALASLRPVEFQELLQPLLLLMKLHQVYKQSILILKGAMNLNHNNKNNKKMIQPQHKITMELNLISLVKINVVENKVRKMQ
ncbi:hypothetical protein DY000_02058505 [Brassica cretica]|uniref:Uncharacterized protein n=1 Tax=Brassica cretica TaxID=69181 RepID=A0ABQ7AP92_BRACR|nr:hypothetical protein DY000_02058505 [Brassica cretica]